MCFFIFVRVFLFSIQVVDIHVLQHKKPQSIGQSDRMETLGLVDHKQRRQSDLFGERVALVRNQSLEQFEHQANKQCANKQ